MDRRRALVVFVIGGQLLVLLLGFAVLESWLASSIRLAVAERSYTSQRGIALMLTGEVERLGVKTLAPDSADWRKALEAVSSWHPESGWFVSIIETPTGVIRVDPRADRIGTVQAGFDSLLGPPASGVNTSNPVPQTVDGNWVVSVPLASLDAALVVHAPMAVAAARTQRFLTTLRSVGLVIVFAIAGFGGTVTSQLIRRYDARLHAINQSLEAKVKKRTEQLQRNRDAVIYAVAKVAEARDEGTGQHLERISAYTEILAEELLRRRPELGAQWPRVVSMTSILHDIGKVGIPDEVLLKPGKLTEDERATIQKHTIIGSDTLQAIRMQWGRDDFLDTAREIVLGHHEQWDGGGYPLGVSGETIPLSARIVAVADVYDALTSERPYKQAMTHDEAAQRLRDGAGTHFDPELIAVFEAVSQQMDKARGKLQDALETAPSPSKVTV